MGVHMGSCMYRYEGGKAELLVALSMMEAGSSVTITSLCNAGVFFVACAIPRSFTDCLPTA